jgi:hypothetical protein
MTKNIRIQIALLFYFVMVSTVIYYNPTTLYINNINGDLKEFGLGENKTRLPLWLVILIMAFISYYTSCYLLRSIT